MHFNPASVSSRCAKVCLKCCSRDSFYSSEKWPGVRTEMIWQKEKDVNSHVLILLLSSLLSPLHVHLSLNFDLCNFSFSSSKRTHAYRLKLKSLKLLKNWETLRIMTHRQRSNTFDPTWCVENRIPQHLLFPYLLPPFFFSFQLSLFSIFSSISFFLSLLLPFLVFVLSSPFLSFSYFRVFLVLAFFCVFRELFTIKRKS